jgi:hypothetical protein
MKRKMIPAKLTKSQRDRIMLQEAQKLLVGGRMPGSRYSSRVVAECTCCSSCARAYSDRYCEEGVYL